MSEMLERNGVIAPLRIANEAFMVAATIERCPKLMMLRELVMNAIEAAAGASDAPKQVCIAPRRIDGVDKLSIWNTGRGLSAEELLRISDLSSSLFKEVSLDGNFGMGAKAASLTSNRHGLRYRSCRLGRVSQVTLGERGGVYGRLVQADPTVGEPVEVADVTASAVAEGYSVSHDWTEVVLLGNSADQDTTRDPYAGDPAVAPDWVLATLSKRFFRVPGDVSILIEVGASGGDSPVSFAAALRSDFFDRMESVATPQGIVLHYAYRAADSIAPVSPIGTGGLGAVLHAGEVYALVEARRWMLEAPTYGFTFAARFCTVLVELPPGFGAQPEQYRQFLRFRDGDQRQVTFADFGEMVRENIPGWLRRIIAAMLPRPDDFLAEIRSDLQQMLMELGIEDRLQPAPAAKSAVTSAEPRQPSAETPPAPPRTNLPTPPEIILVEDEEEIVEKMLGGRAARWYDATRQVFVNTRYVAFARMRARLTEEFAAAAEPTMVKGLARQAVEATLVRHLARSLVHSIAKPRLGWTEAETRSVQTPEALSLLVDDDELMLSQARRRMSELLGLDSASKAAGHSFTVAESAGPKHAEDLAEAEARLQRARAADLPRLGGFYRQIAAIHVRRRDAAAARRWLEDGIAADASDPWCSYDLVGLLLADRDLHGAAAAAAEALRRAEGAQRSSMLRRLAEVERARGDVRAAVDLLQQAAAENPTDPWPLADLSAIHLAGGDLDAAQVAVNAALDRSPAPNASLLSRRAALESRRGDRVAAIATLERAVTLDPANPWLQFDLIRALSAAGEAAEALRRIDLALAANPPEPAHFLRLRAEVRRQSGDLAGALAAAEHACAVDPSDSRSFFELSGILLEAKDLDGAAEAAMRAVRLADAPPIWYLRRASAIAARRRDFDAAREWAERAIASDPADPWARMDLAWQLLNQGRVEEAEAAALAALERMTLNPSPALRRLGEIAFRRGDHAAASAWLDRALAADPADPWCRSEYAHQLLARGELDAALAMGEEAVRLMAAPNASLLRRCGHIEARRGNLAAACTWFERSAEADPESADPWLDLSRVLMARGELDAAQRAAERALALGAPKAPTAVPARAA